MGEIWLQARLILFLIVCGQISFAEADIAPLSHDLIVQDCQVLYYTGIGHAYITTDEIKAEQARERFEQRRLPYAKRFFDAMTVPQLRATLEPRIAQAKPGSDAYTSIAYVLADHEVDVQKNLERMKRATNSDSSITGATEDTQALVPLRMVDIYRKCKQDFVLDELDTVQADGELGVALDYIRAGTIAQFPLHLTRYYSQKRNGARMLVDVLKAPGNDYHAWEDGQHALKRVAQNSDPGLARFARRCLSLMAHDKDITPADVRREKAEERREKAGP